MAEKIRVHDTDSFIKKGNIMHFNRYDYSKVKYENYSTPVIIICNNHKSGPKEFTMTPMAHFKGHGCDCYNPKVPNLEKTITESKVLYGDRFDYSKMTEYKKINDKTTIICNKHMEEFIVSVKQLKSGGCTGCKSCTKENRAAGRAKKNITIDIAAPDIAAQWHPTMNGDKKPSDFTRGSNQYAYWLCNVCGHHWHAMINSRVGNGRGCANCDGKVITRENSLGGKNPDAVRLWNYEKNTVDLYSIAPNTKLRVHFICDKEKCNHYEFTMTSLKFNHHGQRCPACAGKVPIPGKALMDIYPGLANFWSPKNEYTGYDLMPFSRKKIILHCNECKYEWDTKPADIRRGFACPKCNPSGVGYSRVAIEWLERIMKYENIHIRHAANGGEYKLPGLGTYVDGYCAESNTVYEFHGTFWHGHPNYYNAEDINRVTGKTHGEAYQNTLDREQRIRDAGYRLIVVWEFEYNTARQG
jgi:hypothetical protein